MQLPAFVKDKWFKEKCNYLIIRIFLVHSGCCEMRAVFFRVNQRRKIIELARRIMKPQSFARMPEIKLIGIFLRIRNEDQSVSREIGNLWQKFFDEKFFDKIPQKNQPYRMIALYTDYDKMGNCTLVLGAQVQQYELDTMPNGMIFKTVPAGHYALFADSGTLKQVVPALWKIIREDKKLQRTFMHDFELYDYPIDMNNGSVDIYVGVHGKL